MSKAFTLGACAIVVATIFTAACSGAPDAPSVSSGPTFHKDVEPILQAHCQSCHFDGGLAPFPLVTYEEAVSKSELVVLKTASGQMPPWNAVETPDCKPALPFRHDERLSAAELATLKAWREAGMPEGDRSSAKAAPKNDHMLKNVTLEVAPSAPFSASGDRDQFRCFVLDPKLAFGAYIKGMQIVPGNAKVVHHAVVFADPKRAALSRGAIGESYECQGNAMFQSDQYILDVWTPGMDPIELPNDISMAIGPNALMIMQVHYSPGGPTAAPDTTKVQLELAYTKPPYLLFTAGFGNYPAALPNGEGLQPGPNDRGFAEFRIPANVRDHTETMLASMPSNIPAGTRIYGVMAHEHLAGTDVTVEHIKSNGETSCLLHDRWNFHWQRMYAYDAPVDKLPKLEVTDKIRVRCKYDNSYQNVQLASELSARGMPLQDVVLGEQTLNEMCLAIPQVLIPHP